MRKNKKYRGGTGNGVYKSLPNEIPADLTPKSHPANPACTAREIFTQNVFNQLRYHILNFCNS